MKDVLSNIWVKRCVSIFNVAYFAVIVLLTYATFLYKLEFAEGMQASFFLIYTFASLVFLILMLYTRNQPITKLLSVLMLPVVVFYDTVQYGHMGADNSAFYCCYCNVFCSRQ